MSLACVFVGSMLYNDLVWNLQDVFDLLIVIPNVIALFALSALVAKEALRGKSDLTLPEEKEAKDKDSLINELKTSGNKFLNMIKERENLIQSCTNKINELNLQLEQKEEQLKMMVNFSKEINKENKSNVQELTKQAVKTIKIFYNTLNNNNGSNDYYNQLEIKSVPIEEKNYIEELESSLVSKKCHIPLIVFSFCSSILFFICFFY